MNGVKVPYFYWEEILVNIKKILINTIVAVVIGLSIVNIVGIFYAKQDPITALKTFPIKSLGFLLLLLAIDYAIQAIRTMIVLRSMGYRITFLQALENFFFVVFFSLVTPMSVGGQPFQIYHLTKLGLSSHDATNISITRMFEGILIVFIISVLMFKNVFRLLRGNLGLSVIVLGFLVTLSISVAGFIAFVNKKFLFAIFRFISRLTKSEKLQKKEKKALEWLDKMSASTKMLFFQNYWALIVDLIIGILGSLIPSFMLKYAIESVSTVRMPLTIIWGAINMLNTIVFYIPTPGSSGGIEGFYQLVLSHFYEPKATMTGIFVFRLVTYYLIVFLGIFLIWRFSRFKEEVTGVGKQELMDDNK